MTSKVNKQKKPETLSSHALIYSNNSSTACWTSWLSRMWIGIWSQSVAPWGSTTIPKSPSLSSTTDGDLYRCLSLNIWLIQWATTSQNNEPVHLNVLSRPPPHSIMIPHKAIPVEFLMKILLGMSFPRILLRGRLQQQRTHSLFSLHYAVPYVLTLHSNVAPRSTGCCYCSKWLAGSSGSAEVHFPGVGRWCCGNPNVVHN